LDLKAGRENISEMFRQFYDLLARIQSLLILIEEDHRLTLEKYLITGMPDGNNVLNTENMSSKLVKKV
jgi:hypothetical protein